MSKCGRLAFTVFDIPEEVVLDNHMVHLLFATCHRYHSMVAKEILVWLQSTYKMRCEYKKKVRVNKHLDAMRQGKVINDGSGTPHPMTPYYHNIPPTIMDLIIEQAVANNNIVIIKWLVDVALVPTTGYAMKMADDVTKKFLVSRGCVRLPVKKERAIVTRGSEKGCLGTLIGIDGRDGIIKLLSNSDIKILPLSFLVHVE